MSRDTDVTLVGASSDIEAMRHLVKKLAGELETIKKGQQAANDAIEELRTEVPNLKTAQIARARP